jgi:hypothetical protein
MCGHLNTVKTCLIRTKELSQARMVLLVASSKQKSLIRGPASPATSGRQPLSKVSINLLHVGRGRPRFERGRLTLAPGNLPNLVKTDPVEISKTSGTTDLVIPVRRTRRSLTPLGLIVKIQTPPQTQVSVRTRNTTDWCTRSNACRKDSRLCGTMIPNRIALETDQGLPRSPGRSYTKCSVRTPIV